MKLLLLLLACLAFSSALVHYHKLEKGEDGCKMPNGKELKVGEFVQDENVCGVYHCRSRDGDSLIMYCQRPPYFSRCDFTAISTTMDFPDCCWTCVRGVDCSADGKPIVTKIK